MVRVAAVKPRVAVWSTLSILVCIAGTAPADFVFGTPVSAGTGWITPSFSTDGLDVYFHLGTDFVSSIWAAHRAGPDAEWSPAAELGPTVNSSSHDNCARISADGGT
ncbi:MAG: hypothetical protein JSW27_07125, partial [Phycisphaerales bacterium]